MVLACLALIVCLTAVVHSSVTFEEGGYAIEARLYQGLTMAGDYIAALVWPPGIPWLACGVEPRQALAAVILLAMVTAGAPWQARSHPYLAVGWSWLLIMLAPVVTIFEIGAPLRGARLCFFPAVGMAIAASWGAAELVEWLRVPRFARWTTAAMALLVLAAECYSDLRAWSSNSALIERVEGVDPANAAVHRLRSKVLASQGDYQQAAAQLRQAMQQARTSTDDLLQLARLSVELGQLDEAEQLYRRVIAASPRDTSADFGLAAVTIRQQRFAEAQEIYREGIVSGSPTGDEYRDLAVASLARDRYDWAADYAWKAVQAEPRSATSWSNLGAILLRGGKLTSGTRSLRAGRAAAGPSGLRPGSTWGWCKRSAANLPQRLRV